MSFLGKDIDKQIIYLIEGHGFSYKFTLPSYEHHFYCEGDGIIIYNPDEEELSMLNEDKCVLILLEGDNLNEFTVAQYLIQYYGK